MIELVGAFSSSTSQETEDTMLLSPSEMVIVGMVAGGVMVGAIGTVAVGMVAGMVGGVRGHYVSTIIRLHTPSRPPH